MKKPWMDHHDNQQSESAKGPEAGDVLKAMQQDSTAEEDLTGDTRTVRLRPLSGWTQRFFYGLAIGFSLFELYVLYVQPIEPWFHRGVFLSLMLVLTFALLPFRTWERETTIPWYDWLLVLVAVSTAGYIVITFDTLIYRAGSSPTNLDVLFGGLAVLLVLEGMRRTAGYALPIICLIFIVYALFGNYIPGPMGHRGYSLPRTLSLLYSTEGLYSVPLGVGATYVFVFILFGIFLQRSAVGDLFTRLALSLTAWTRGGPAKVPIVSSALFGTISGSCVANVVVDGPITIPLMVRGGLDKNTAAAVEAVASTGGQLMPPVMGAAAFLMAEIIGRPYTEIMIAAVIPAVLYYAALYFMIDFYALRHGIFGIPRSKLPSLVRLLTQEGYLLLPLAVLLYVLLVMESTPIRAALWAIVITVPPKV
jgi:TRAP transporter 4TM/12TM fusion protein